MLLQVNIFYENIKFIFHDCLFLFQRGKLCLSVSLSLSFEETDICSVNSYSIDETSDKIMSQEVGFKREKKILGSLWALALESE